MKKVFATLVATAVLVTPFAVFAFPFGGSIQKYVRCYNKAIFARVGAPNGGDFIWTPSTKTYQFGPPMHTGQWLIGLAAPPYYCLVKTQPIEVWSGTLITMMGSSQ
jgi:hypothetical protein